jgi:DNA modification methylase
MEIIYLPIDTVIPYARNPRHNASAVDKVVASIAEFGFKQPIVVDIDCTIIVGHTRWLAAKKLDFKEVPVLVATDLTPQQIAAYRIADNRTAEYSSWDDALLGLELQALQDAEYDLDVLGFSERELHDLLLLNQAAADTDEDTCPALAETSICKPGDVWLMGEHRLMCGDSTSVTALDTLMAGSWADMVFTDPPYNVDYRPEDRPVAGVSRTQRGKQATGRPRSQHSALGGIRNDKMRPDEFLTFLRSTFAASITALKGGGAIYVCHADTAGLLFRTAFEEVFKLNSVLIWAKSHFTIGRNDYHWMHEPILYGWQKDNKHTWHGDRKQTTVWNISRDDSDQYQHPTQKPVALPERAILNPSKSDDIVLDMFGGSGSTLIACQKTKRVSYTMELDPKYCDVIIKRWQQYTGKQAVHADTGQAFG